MATLAYRDISRNQLKTVSSISTDHRTGDSAGDLISGVYLRNSSSSCFQLFALLDLILWACFGSFIDPNPDLGDTFLESSNKTVRELCGVYRHG